MGEWSPMSGVTRKEYGAPFHIDLIVEGVGVLRWRDGDKVGVEKVN